MASQQCARLFSCPHFPVSAASWNGRDGKWNSFRIRVHGAIWLMGWILSRVITKWESIENRPWRLHLVCRSWLESAKWPKCDPETVAFTGRRRFDLGTMMGFCSDYANEHRVLIEEVVLFCLFDAWVCDFGWRICGVCICSNGDLFKMFSLTVYSLQNSCKLLVKHCF